MTRPLDCVLDRLAGVRKSGSGHSAHCPAHEDRHASLSVSETADGKVLLHCHAGCDLAAVLAAAHLEATDLFPPKPGANGQTPRRQIVATYDYTDEAGKLLFQAVRFEPKDFKQRRPDGAGGWAWKLGNVRHVLYRLPALLAADPAATVWIPEGEKDVDRLVSLGLVATTSPMGAGKWRAEYAETLRGRQVVILTDNDAPGRKHAAAVAKSLAGVAASVRTVELPGLAEKGDVSDWLNAGGTVKELERLAALTGDTEPSPPEWEPPAPFFEPDPPSFPVDVFPAWLHDQVKAVAIALQVPLALPAMTGLSVLAVCCAKRVEVVVKPGWQEPVNVYTTTVLPPGERKSPAVEAMARPVLDFDQAERKRMGPEIAAATARYRIAETRYQQTAMAAAKAKPEDVERLTADAARMARELLGQKPPEPPRMLADDCTPEKLAALICDNGGRIAVLAAEGDFLEIISGRYSDKANLGIFLRAHSGDPHMSDRVGRPSEDEPRPALTLGLSVQPDVMTTLYNQPGFRGRGVMARFLYAWPTPMVGHRDTDSSPVPENVRTEYHRRVKALLALPPGGIDANGRYVPYLLHLAPAALGAFRAFERELEPRLGEGGDLAPLADWGAKLAGAVARLASLLHAAKCAGEAVPWARPIERATVEAAIKLGYYLIAHAKIAFGAMGADAGVETARLVLRWIVRNGRDWFTRREAFRALQGSFKTVEMLDAPLRLLEAHQFIRERTPEPQPGPGRKPGPAFDVNPLTADCVNNVNTSDMSPDPDSTNNPAALDAQPEEPDQGQDPGPEPIGQIDTIDKMQNGDTAEDF